MIVGGLIGLCIGLFNSLREGGTLNELINSKQLNEPQNEFAQYVPQVDMEKPVSSAKVKSFNILGSELLIPTPPMNGQGLFALNGQRSCSKLTNSCSGV